MNEEAVEEEANELLESRDDGCCLNDFRLLLRLVLNNDVLDGCSEDDDDDDENDDSFDWPNQDLSMFSAISLQCS